MIPPRKPIGRLRPALDRLETRSLMAFAGGLDPTFGVGGYYEAPFTPNTNIDSVVAVALEMDGSIVEAGETNLNLFGTLGLVHLTASGTRDASFGAGGVAEVPELAGQLVGYESGKLLVQPDGKIIVLTTTVVRIGTGPQQGDAVVERFDANGTIDTTFGTQGQVVLGPNGVADGGASFGSAALQPDGQVVLAGSVANPQSTNGSSAVALARLGADGRLDTTYGTHGLAIVTGATPAQVTGTGQYYYGEGATGLAIQPDGQAVAAATLTTEVKNALVATTEPEFPEVFRLDADGTRDTSLAQAGLQATAMMTTAGVLLQPDGQILVDGSEPRPQGIGPILVRLNSNGSLDRTATLPAGFAGLGGYIDLLGGFALAPDGDVALTIIADRSEAGVAQLTPNLTPDDTFGDAGYLNPAIPVSVTSAGNEIAVDSSGQIILAEAIEASGTGANSYTISNVVARLTATGTSAHPGDGVADPAIYLTAPGSFAVKTSGGGPGQTVQLGSPGPGNSIPVPGDYYGTGQDDLAVYLTASGTFAVKDPSGKTPGFEAQLGSPGLGNSIPVPGDYYATGQADLAVYLTGPGVFAIKDPSGATPGMQYQLGIPGRGQSVPVPGDYYGTGQTDLAVYLAQAGIWAVKDPTGKTPGFEAQFGKPGLGHSIPVPGDYDGSGRTELAVYLPDSAELIYRPAFGGPDVTIPFGVPGPGQALPAPGDYDGSGRTEVAAYIPSQGLFAYRPAKGGKDVYLYYGTPGPGQSIPVTAVVLSPFPGTVPPPGAGSGGSVALPGAMGQADALDFLPDTATTAARKKAGGPSAS